MDRLRLKHLTAVALSLWLGFLACVLGCGQAVSEAAASTRAQISQLKAAATKMIKTGWLMLGRVVITMARLQRKTDKALQIFPAVLWTLR